jgi:imidazolonepropionase-like amidohydrolase
MDSEIALSRRDVLRLGAGALGASLFAGCEVGPSDGVNRLVVRGARLIDGTGQPPTEDVTIVVEDDRIAQVVSGTVDGRRGAQVIEARGLTVIPGLIDMHVHSRAWVWPLFLRFGVTTVRDLGSSPTYIYHARESEQAGRMVAPRIIAAGPVLDGTPPAPNSGWAGMQSLANAYEAEVAAEQLIRQGMDWLKVYARLPYDSAQAVLAVAKANGVPVAGHVGAITARAAIDLGVRTIEHASGIALPLAGAELEDAARLFVGTGAFLDPTLLVMNHLSTLPTVATPGYPGLDLVAPDERNQWLAWRTDVRFRGMNDAVFARRQRQLAGEMALVKAVHDLGGRLLVGSDTPNPFVVPGMSLHQEMALMVQAGVPPISVIHAATGAASEALGRPELGTIAVGALADLVLVSGNPAEEIEATRRIQKVIKGGTVVHAA